jgi:integrase
VAIVEQPDKRWRVEVVGIDDKPVHKTFSTYGRAKAWESRHRNAIERYGLKPQANVTAAEVTLGELIKRYRREVTPRKRSAESEAYQIGAMMRGPIAALTLADITSKVIADYRNERLADVGNNAVRAEISIIRRTIEVARREWGFEVQRNPAALVTLPPPGGARDRRLNLGEYEKLEAALSRSNPTAWAVVQFAVETAMRRGEILSLTWRNVDMAQRFAHLPVTKNGSPRTVPLSDEAMKVLAGLKPDGERVFGIDEHSLRWAFNRACERAGIKGLRFHDIRHEGISRLFERGLGVAEVSLISGHRTPSQLFRYVNLRPTGVRDALDKKPWPNPNA